MAVDVGDIQCLGVVCCWASRDFRILGVSFLDCQNVTRLNRGVWHDCLARDFQKEVHKVFYKIDF